MHPFFDATLDLDLACLLGEPIDDGPSSDGQNERRLVLAAFDTLEFEACSLEICCWDWDRLGKDDRIGDVPAIHIRDLLSPHSKLQTAPVAAAEDEADDRQVSDNAGGSGDPVEAGSSNDFSQLQ